MFVPWCADPAPAADLFPNETRTGARTFKGEKPHQGVFGKNPALFLGHEVCNSTTALGLPGVWLEKGNGSRCTGKERDTESGLDYMGARYYSNGLGRWITPDWSAVPVPVPYADLTDPQSLNQYSYVRGLPTVRVDVDGHQTSDPPSANVLSRAVSGCQDVGGNTCSAIRNLAQSQAQTSGEVGNETPQRVVITYDSAAPPMAAKTEQYVAAVANDSGVRNINVSATTNGQHAPNSNHYNGTAVDINKVYGKKVSTSATDLKTAAQVNAFQHSANKPGVGVAHENYGPAGLYKDGARITNDKLQGEHENHIHITIPRESHDDH